MEDSGKAIVVYTGVCRCCLQDKKDDNSFLGLWDQHLYNDSLEVYGEMITECFLMPWLKPEVKVEQICLNCVSKVREAYSFKQQLLAVEEHLAQNFGQGGEEEDKSGIMRGVHFDHNEKCTANQVDQECSGSEDKASSDQDQLTCKDEYLIETLESSDSEYENVEYIDQCSDIGKENGQEPAETKRKQSKKKKGEKIRNYKYYSPEDMRKAVECVTEGTLMASEAAAKFGVPRKTIMSFIRRQEEQSLNGTTLEPIEDINRVKMMNLISDIVKILTYTNATPYRVTKTSYGCVYCTFVLNTTRFQDSEVLRVHTRVEHANERLQVQNIMRPYTANEILKLDIYQLVCTVCCEAITSWMGMFEHLHKVHDVALDEAYIRVIPYVLDISNYKCAICKEKFNSYHLLDTHMNCHYNNYECAECSDTFLTRTRIIAHMKVHSKEKFPCGYPKCRKVFRLERYKRKHYMLVHTNEKRVQCQYCDLKFHDALRNHLHVVECHNEKVTYITCDLCGMVFDWEPHYYAHMTNKHKSDCAVRCKYCNVLFTKKSLLKTHMRKHIELSNYCDVCNKTYSSEQYLKHHKWQKHGIID